LLRASKLSTDIVKTADKMAPSVFQEDTSCRSIGSPAIFTDGAESFSSVSSRSSPALSSSSTERAETQDLYDFVPTKTSKRSKETLARQADNFDAMRFPAHGVIQQPLPSFKFQPVSAISRARLSFSKLPTIADLQTGGSSTDSGEWELLSYDEIMSLSKSDIITLLREIGAQNGLIWQEAYNLVEPMQRQIEHHVFQVLLQAATENRGAWYESRSQIMLLIQHFETKDPRELDDLLYWDEVIRHLESRDLGRLAEFFCERENARKEFKKILTPNIIDLVQFVRTQVGNGPHPDFLRLRKVMHMNGWSDEQVSWIYDVLARARKHHQWSDEEVDEIVGILPEAKRRNDKTSRLVKEIKDVYRGVKDVLLIIDGKPVKNEYTMSELIDLLRGVGHWGMGNWTKILNDKRYTFYCRSALDLKDRFRVSCPQYYPSRLKKADTTPSKDEVVDVRIRSQSNRRGKEVEYFTPQDLKRYGIKVPFSESGRRGRHDYTKQEDADILDGFHKHNGSWAAIKKDPKYKLDSRTATDIRDRMRNEYTELYVASGRCLVSVKVPDAERRPKRTAAAKTVNAEYQKKAPKKASVKKPRAPRTPRAKKGSTAASKAASTTAVAEALSKMDFGVTAPSTLITTDSSPPQAQQQLSSADQHCASPSDHSSNPYDSPSNTQASSPHIDCIISNSPHHHSIPHAHSPRATWGALSLAPAPLGLQPFPTAPITISRSQNDPYNNIRLETFASASPPQQQQLSTPPNSLPSFASFVAPLVSRRSTTPTPHGHDDQMECDARPEGAAVGHSSFVPATSNSVVAPVLRGWLAKLG
jgi:hypothetical protein